MSEVSKPHSIADEIMHGVTLPDYHEMSVLARAYLSLEEQFHALRGECRQLERERNTLQGDHHRMKEQLAAARNALTFYADDANYYAMSLMLRRFDSDERPAVMNDLGGRARAALNPAKSPHS